MLPKQVASAADIEETRRVAIAATLDTLRRNASAGHVLVVGEPFPDFLLPNAEGQLVDRADLLASGAAVITFFRGDWCRVCRAAMDGLEAALPAIEAQGAALTAVLPETGGRALDAKRKRGLHYRVLVDVDHGLAIACGVALRMPEPFRAFLRATDVDLVDRQGNGAWVLPIPATFILDQQGIVRWSFVDIDFTHRANPDEVIAALMHGRAEQNSIRWTGPQDLPSLS